MPVKYNQDTKAKAIRLVREHAAAYESEYAAITAVAGRLGMSAETLRKWIRRAEVDQGQAPGVTSGAAREIRIHRRSQRRRDPLPLSRQQNSDPVDSGTGSHRSPGLTSGQGTR